MEGAQVEPSVGGGNKNDELEEIQGNPESLGV